MSELEGSIIAGVILIIGLIIIGILEILKNKESSKIRSKAGRRKRR